MKSKRYRPAINPLPVSVKVSRTMSQATQTSFIRFVSFKAGVTPAIGATIKFDYKGKTRIGQVAGFRGGIGGMLMDVHTDQGFRSYKFEECTALPIGR